MILGALGGDQQNSAHRHQHDERAEDDQDRILRPADPLARVVAERHDYRERGAGVDQPFHEIGEVVDDDLIKPRPAFHYRLANCCVDDPDWSIAEPWRRWLKIEALALDRERLVDCCNAFLKDRQRTLGRFDNQWREEVQQWLPGS